MHRVKRSVITTLLLLSLTLSLAPLPVAHSDGATSSAEVSIEWYQGVWKGQGIDTDTESNLDDNLFALYHDSEFNFSLLSITTVNITRLRAYVEWDATNDAFSRDWRVAVFNYTDIDDGGARAYFEDWELQNLDGNPPVKTWVSRTLTTEWELDADREYFFGFGTESGAGTVRLQRQTNGAPGSGSIFDNAGWEGSDPFNEWANWDTEEWNIQIKYWGFNVTATAHNQYYGNATHFVTRRDLDYTFPIGTTQREIRIIFPSSENIVNLTRSNGGLWDTVVSPSTYSVGTFNGTHDVLMIPHAVLILYEGDYRMFTTSYETLLTFDGLFWENGTREGNVTITVHTPSNSTEYFVNDTRVVGFDEEVIMITWPLDGGGFRQFVITFSAESLVFFTPVTTYSAYTFYVKDYVGYLGNGGVYLEALRVINGTEFLIQRAEIRDSVTGVPMTLEQYVIYILQIRTTSDVYRFGYFTTEYDPEITLRLRGLEFSKRSEATYKYTAIEGTRPNATHLRGTYVDIRNKTTSVLFEVLYRNYTLVYDDSSGTAPSVQFNYYGADNDTDYVVHMVAIHQEFGTIEEYFPLSGVSDSPNAVPTLSGFPITYVFGNLLLLACFGVVSETTAPEGAFFVWIIAVILNASGFVSIPSDTFIYVIALIGLMKMRGTSREATI